jgi:mycoredoxin
MNDLTVYGRPMCPMLPRTRLLLRLARVPYTYINIHADDSARARVREINNGNESVPTLVFADGSTLTEPAMGLLRTRLQTLGFAVPPAWTDGLLQQQPLLVIAAGVLVGSVLGAVAGNPVAGAAWGVAGGFLSNTVLMQIAGR